MTDPKVPSAPETPTPGGPEAVRAVAVLQVVAGALAASVVIYAGVAWFLTTEAAGAGLEARGLPALWARFLAVCGIGLILVAPLVERRIRASGKGQELGSGLSEYRTAVLVGFALREAASLLGLVIAVLTGDAFWCYVLSAAALVAMAVGWPSRSRLEGVARSAVQPT